MAGWNDDRKKVKTVVSRKAQVVQWVIGWAIGIGMGIYALSRLIGG